MFAYDVAFAPTVAICVKVVPSFERSTLKPVSLPELSDHVRLICDEETPAAVRLEGAAGAVEASVVALASFE